MSTLQFLGRESQFNPLNGPTNSNHSDFFFFSFFSLNRFMYILFLFNCFLSYKLFGRDTIWEKYVDETRNDEQI